MIIVGAGQAGLAMGHSLLQKGFRPQEDFVLIDAATQDDLAWTRRWHSLTLFTSAHYSALPGMAFPGDANRYPRADEVAEYLRDYADQMGLRPAWGTRALAVTPTAGSRSLTLRTSDGDFETRNVVAATGPFSLPCLPSFAGGTVVPGINIHSSQYTHPKQIPQGTVLIVGAGNTGRQLARELSFSHDVTLASGSTQPELPQRLFGRDVFAWLSRTGLLSFPVPAPVRGSLVRGEVVIGNPLPELRTLGVRTVGRVTNSSEGVFYTADSLPVTPDSVIWATGFEPGFDWLPGDIRNSDGHVVHRRGATRMAGLFVLGMPWMRSRGSALITGVGNDASHIARLIRDRP
ncbi:MAG: NAD(P)-binding domain-containing protein [Rhodoglobus sp.]|nr:NAD(P)-binding domain-containing protein [Rhodoglobus sp.]